MRALFSLSALTAASFIAIPAAFSAPAPSWTVDATKSKVAFVASMNGQDINGTFHKFETHIAFDPSNLAGSSIEADIDTGSAVTGDETRDEALPTEDWFSIKAFPTAVFKATQFQSQGNNHYIANGTLSIRGVSRPVSLPFDLTITGNQAHASATLTIDRRWFGVGQGQFAGTDAVAANVRVNILLDAHQ